MSANVGSIGMRIEYLLLMEKKQESAVLSINAVNNDMFARIFTHIKLAIHSAIRYLSVR